MLKMVAHARVLLNDERVRYLVVGGSVAGLYLVLYAGFSLAYPHLNYLVVLAIAQVIIISIAFPLYRTFVFRSQGSLRGDLTRFLGVWAGNLTFGTLGLAFLVQVVGMPQIPAQFITVAVVSVVSFLGHRFVSFRVSD